MSLRGYWEMTKDEEPVFKFIGWLFVFMYCSLGAVAAIVIWSVLR